jgi:hypothetical protein
VGHNNRHRLRQLVVLTVAVLALVPYPLLALVIYVQPWSAPFDGWIAIVQQTGSPSVEQLELRTDAVELDRGDGRPLVEYTAIACGSQRFEGLLLLGGDARLGGISIVRIGPDGRRVDPQPPIPQPWLRSMTVAFKEVDRFDLGEVQAVYLAIDPSPVCAPRPLQCRRRCRQGLNPIHASAFLAPIKSLDDCVAPCRGSAGRTAYRYRTISRSRGAFGRLDSSTRPGLPREDR